MKNSPEVLRWFSTFSGMTILALVLLFIASPTAHAAPQRIITIGGALTEIVYALGAEDHLVGNDTTSYYPKAADKLPKVGYQRALSAEGMLSLEPSLIILTEQAGPPPVIQQLESTGVEILRLKAARSLEGVKTNILAIGKALGREAQAKELNLALENAQQALRELRAESDEKPKALFLLQHGGGAPMVAGAETAAHSIIQLSGAQNVVQEYEGYKPLTPEAAVSLQPDVILITKQGLERAGGKEMLLKTPGLSLTPAAKNGRVIAMDSLLMLGFGPRTVEAAMTLHKAYQKL